MEKGPSSDNIMQCSLILTFQVPRPTNINFLLPMLIPPGMKRLSECYSYIFQVERL